MRATILPAFTPDSLKCPDIACTGIKTGINFLPVFLSMSPAVAFQPWYISIHRVVLHAG